MGNIIWYLYIFLHRKPNTTLTIPHLPNTLEDENIYQGSKSYGCSCISEPILKKWVNRLYECTKIFDISKMKQSPVNISVCYIMRYIVIHIIYNVYIYIEVQAMLQNGYTFKPVYSQQKIWKTTTNHYVDYCFLKQGCHILCGNYLIWSIWKNGLISQT